MLCYRNETCISPYDGVEPRGTWIIEEPVYTLAMTTTELHHIAGHCCCNGSRIIIIKAYSMADYDPTMA